MGCCQSQYNFEHVCLMVSVFFFFNDTATTEIYTLSLHDALPIWASRGPGRRSSPATSTSCPGGAKGRSDRKSTRLNSSHSQISYAVFCLKKKSSPCPGCARPIIARQANWRTHKRGLGCHKILHHT